MGQDNQQINQKPSLPIKTKIAVILMIIIGLASLLFSFFLSAITVLPIYSEGSACAGTLFFNGFLFCLATLPLLDTFFFKNRRVAWWFSLVMISFSAIISIISCPLVLTAIIIPPILILSDRKNFFKIAS